MENLNLLEIHKRKTILWHAFVKFAFIYLCILVFLFTSVYFRNVSENNVLKAKVSKVITIVQNQAIFSGESEIEEIERRVLNDTYIYNDSGKVLSYIDDRVSGISIPNNTIVKIDEYKYYSTQLTKDKQVFSILVRSLSNNFFTEIVYTLFVIIFLSPIVYFFLVWISELGLKKVYKPIEEIIESLEWFAININHEFKTSLSEIISSLELAKITNEYEESTEQSIASAKRLNATLDSLSLMIHFVNTDYRKENTNVTKELDASMDDFLIMMEDKDIKLVKKYNLQKPIFRNIDKAPLVLCFTNIFKNAIRYSHASWVIEIHIEKNHFIIKDYWVGIEKENLGKIFERHFRESYAGQWTGIWLSLVKKITDIYHWDVSIDSEKWEYTEIKLSF